MELHVISKDEFDLFLESSPRTHFMQTSAWGDVNIKRGFNPIYVGFYRENRIIGGALLLEKKILSFKTFYSPRGPLIDYSNKEEIKESIALLKNYCDENNGLYLKINPDIIIRKLNEKGEVIFVDEYNLSLVDYFKNLGAKHRGFTTKFTESSAPRFTFRSNIDLEKDNLLKTFHNTTKKILSRNNPYGIEIYKGGIDDLKDFYQVEKETCIRKGIYLSDYSFFYDFYTTLNAKGMADLYIAKVNIANLKNVYINKIKELEEEVKKLSLNENKNTNIISELSHRIEKMNYELSQIVSSKEDNVVLSGIITANYGDTIWTIHGGNSDRLPFLNACYEIYFYIMQDAKNNGCKLLDFYGSDGKVDKNSPIYGIFMFKCRFGGDFDEFIGEFDIVTRPLANFIISKLIVLRRKIKMSFNKIMPD